jgi:hypothetical protein
MLGIGICFGDSMDGGEVKQIKRAGAAKILAIVAGKENQRGSERESEGEELTKDDKGVNTDINNGHDLTETAMVAPPIVTLPPPNDVAPPASSLCREDSVGAVQSFVYHYTVSNGQHGASVREASYSYAINIGLDYNWSRCNLETAGSYRHKFRTSAKARR